MDANHTKSSKFRAFLMYISCSNYCPNLWMASRSQKPTSSCLRLLAKALLYYCCSNCIVYSVPFCFFFLLLPYVFWHDNPAIRSFCSVFLPHTDLLLVAGAAAFTASQLGQREVHSCIRQTLQGCNVYPLIFFGQNIGGSSLTEFIQSPVFVGAFAAVKSSRVPVKQTRHAETERAMPVARFSFHWPLCYDHALVAITD